MFVRTYILTILDSGFLFKQNYGTAVHQATNLLLPGGDIQIFINFRDPHHTPVKEYIDKMIKEKATGWTDAKIPSDVETMVEYLEKRERSAKIVQQGQILRGISSTTRSGVEYQQQKQSQTEKR